MSQARGHMHYAWLAFVLAHGYIAWHLLYLGDLGFRDVYLYHRWQRLSPLPVFDMDWVYPVGALVPMRVIGFIENPTEYLWAWLLVVAFVNSIVVYFVAHHLRHGVAAAVWWMTFIALIGPTAFARLDAFSSALAIIAIVLLGERTAQAVAYMTAAGWVKVAHFFWLPILFVTSRKPWREVFMPFAIVTAVVGAIVWFGRASDRLFSFVMHQGARGLQVESVLAAPFHISRIRGHHQIIEYNDKISTVEILGELPAVVARYSDYVMFAAVGIFTLLAWRAMRRRPSSQMRWVMWGLLGVTASLLVFNKVGSPQLLVWLAAPVMLIISRAGKEIHRNAAWVLAIVVLACGAATQVIYPLFYQEFFDLHPPVMAAYFARSIALIGLVGVSAIALMRRVR